MTDKLLEYLAGLKPVLQLYKAEFAAIGWTIGASIGIKFNLTIEQLVALAALVGYTLSYLSVKPFKLQ